MSDIFLRAGQTNPFDVKLIDPTATPTGTPTADNDSGSLTDGVLGILLSTPNDTNSLTDGVLSIVLSGIAETSTAVDTAITVALSTPADSSTATDAATYAATLSDADAATLSDALSQIVITGSAEDAMTMTESASFIATVADTEQATGSDLASLISLFGLNETALINEFADVIETNMINVMDADSATISESASLLIRRDLRGGRVSSPRSTTDYRRHRTIITHFPASPSLFDVESKTTVQTMQLDGTFDDDDDKAITLMLGEAA